MKKILSFASVIAVAAVLASCSATTPLAVSAAPIGNKTGVSKCNVFMGIQLNKNFGIADAAKNGGIKGSVAIADLKVTNYVLFVKKEIIVHGN